MSSFNEKVCQDLHQYLLAMGETDERMPDAPDIEDMWEQTAQAYLPDGVREFSGYPVVSLGWMMYIGMAMAKMWDEDWEKHSQLDNIYLYLRNQRGYDCMDEYIREEVLGLSGDDYTYTEKLVAECASRTNSQLSHAGLEPGTKEAFRAYVEALHNLYTMGAAVQLHRMGYHMTKMG